MICQLCLSKPATMRITERLPAGGFAEAKYCLECFEAKYVKPPPGPASFPRPRFTIKNFMILVALWAIPNAVVAWFMRSGLVIGTSKQLREWTIAAFLAVNLVFAFFGAWFCLMAWLQRVTWYNQTGGVLPMPARQRVPRKQQLVASLLFIPAAAWLLAAVSLGHWLTPKTWPRPKTELTLVILIMWAPFIPFVVAALYRGVWKNPVERERIRSWWSLMSPTERVLRAIALFWLLGFFVLMLLAGPSLVRRGFQPWFPIPPAFVIMIVGQLMLMAGIAFSVRRR